MAAGTLRKPPRQLALGGAPQAVAAAERAAAPAWAAAIPAAAPQPAAIQPAGWARLVQQMAAPPGRMASRDEGLQTFRAVPAVAVWRATGRRATGSQAGSMPGPALPE